MQSPCKDCPDRKLGCHSICEKYIEYTKFREELRRKRQEAYRQDHDYYAAYFRNGRGKKRD
ncbi:MAG: hypothetical protein J6S14_12425 [Clostridia bacterium]|nr:hypothetical protein [Clostridia bacterium]